MNHCAETKRRPNILVILTDDQRYDTINALGNHEIYTPNIDRLVERGVSFVNGYIMGGPHCAVCMPSRAMLLTGRNAFSLERCGYTIPAQHMTLPQTFAQNGYHTIGIGKWHNGVSSYARSFTDGAEILFAGMEDHWNVPLCGFQPDGRYPSFQPLKTQLHLGRGKEVVERSYDHIYKGRHSSEIFADAAIRMIHKYAHSDKPFLLYLATMAPHDPRTMPPQYLAMYDPDILSLPENYLPEHPFDKGDMKLRDEYLAPFPRTPQSIRKELAAYYGMISHLDAQIGRVLDALEETGQADNTIIVFAGDNGLAIGSHGLMGKQSLYEHSIRVPLIMAGPGIPRGERRECVAFLNQIFPTLCEMADIPRPQSVQFSSLAKCIKGECGFEAEPALFLYTTFSRAVRKGPYKLIEYLVDGKRMTQLFDLDIDPWEMTNLYLNPEYGPLVEEMRDLLLKYQRFYADPMTGMFGHYEEPAPVAGSVVAPEKMKAILCHGIFDYSLDTIARPQVGPGEWVAQVGAAAVTWADQLAFQGSTRYWGNGDPAALLIPPVVPLGEFVGMAGSYGMGVSQTTRFIVESVVPCGNCRYCKEGQFAYCADQALLGFKANYNGAAAESIMIPRNARIHWIPEDMPTPIALLVPDVVQAKRCVQLGNVSPGDLVVLYCYGPVGLAVVRILASRDCKRLVVLSEDEECLAAAKALGATYCLNPEKTTILRDKRMLLLGEEFDLLHYSGEYGCDVFINTFPNAKAMRLGMELLSARGRYIEAAIFDGWTLVDWSLICAQKELRIDGVRRGIGDYDRAIEELQRDGLFPRLLHYTQYTASNWRESFEKPIGALEKRLLCL